MDWLLNLQGNPQDRELQQGLQDWLQASPEHRRAYQKAEKVWRLSGQLMSSPAFDCPLPPPPRAPIKTQRWYGRRAFAGVLAACIVLLVAPDWQGINADYSTPVGELRQVSLADGTVVDLDSGSAIDVQFSGQKRHVTLLRGQAFFAVTSQPERVFEVSAGEVTVTVTGTAFAVELSPQAVDVSVAKGSVNVLDQQHPGAAVQPLKPGQRVSVRRQGDGGVRLGTLPVEQVAPWRHGQMLVIDQPLSEIVERLRRYQPGLIVLNDEALGKRKITAALDLRSPRQALQAAIAPLGGRVKTLSPYVLMISGAD